MNNFVAYRRKEAGPGATLSRHSASAMFIRQSLAVSGIMLLAANSSHADIASDLEAGISIKGAVLNAFLEGKDLAEIQDELAENGWAVEFVIDSALEPTDSQYWSDRRESGLADCGSPGGISAGPVGASNLACNVQCGFPDIGAGGGGQGSLAMRCQAPATEFDRPGVTDNLQTAEALQRNMIQGIQTTNSAPPEIALTTRPIQDPLQNAALPELGDPANLGSLLQTPENVVQPALTLAGTDSQWSYRLWDPNRTTGNAINSNNDDSVNAVAVNTDGDIEEAIEIVNSGGLLCPDGSRGFGNCGDPSPN